MPRRSRLPVKEWPQIRMVRALVGATDRFTDAIKQVLKREELTLPEFDVIAALGNTDGLRMSDIARTMLMSSSPSNATRVCSVLEKRGLVKRSRSPDNDREVIARLTPEGRAKFDSCFDKVVGTHAELVDATLSEQEQLEATRLLDKFVARQR